MRVVVVGLGPGPADLLTVRGERILRQAGRLFLRTERHPVAQALRDGGRSFQTFDALYEEKPTFEEVYQAIARRLVDEARGVEGGEVSPAPVAYGVPGHPLVGERSVAYLLELAPREGVEVALVPAPSSAEAAWAELRVDPLSVGAAVVDAHELAQAAARPEALPEPSGAAWERRRGYLVMQLDSLLVASEVKAALGRLRGDQQPVAVVRGAGGEGAVVEWIPLHRLDRGRTFDHETSLYVPPVDDPEAAGPGEAVEALVRIMARLRSPDGCPWDRKQTPHTLRRYVVDEAYEVCDAIERGDPLALCDELGDLLLQVLFQAQIADEEGRFDMAEVGAGLRRKLIRRHPHVFGDARVKDAQEVLERWEAIKRREKQAQQPSSAGGGERSLMEGVTAALPALSFAEAVQRRAASVGFEWPDLAGAGRKAVEEAQELRRAWAQQDREAAYRELGDLLFAVVNVARYMHLDPEMALRDASRRFVARFRRMEEMARARGWSLGEMTLEEMDALWNEAKREEVGGRG